MKSALPAFNLELRDQNLYKMRFITSKSVKSFAPAMQSLQSSSELTYLNCLTRFSNTVSRYKFFL